MLSNSEDFKGWGKGIKQISIFFMEGSLRALNCILAGSRLLIKLEAYIWQDGGEGQINSKISREGE